MLRSSALRVNFQIHHCPLREKLYSATPTPRLQFTSSCIFDTLRSHSLLESPLSFRFQQHRSGHYIHTTAQMATPAAAADAKAIVNLVESAKRAAAFKAVEEHFDPIKMTHVGIGSGSTVAYVVEAIAASMKAAGTTDCVFVPTGSQSKGLILKAGLTPITYESITEQQMLDVAFDGADECDEDFNLVKGGGLCLFQEKLVAIKAKTFICVAGVPLTSHTNLWSNC